MIDGEGRYMHDGEGSNMHNGVSSNGVVAMVMVCAAAALQHHLNIFTQSFMEASVPFRFVLLSRMDACGAAITFSSLFPGSMLICEFVRCSVHYWKVSLRCATMQDA